MKKVNLKFRVYFLVTFFSIATQILFAQKVKVSGIVKDTNGFPLHGASVFLKNKKEGVITDSNGHYEMTVDAGEQTIVASFVGYAEQERNVYLVKGIAAEENFVTAEVYKDCVEVVIICKPVESRIQSVTPQLPVDLKIIGKKLSVTNYSLPMKKF